MGFPMVFSIVLWGFHRFQADFYPNFPGAGPAARPPSVAHRPLEQADFAGTRNGRVAGGLSGGCFRGSEEWLINGNLVGEIDIYLIKRYIYLIDL